MRIDVFALLQIVGNLHDVIKITRRIVAPDLENGHQAGVAAGESVHVEHLNLDLARWFDVSVYPDGPDRAVCLYDDITERKRTEVAVQAVSVELKRTLDTAATGLTRCNRDLQYLSANPAYARIVGLPLDQIVGRPIVDVMGPNGFAVIRPHVERVLRGERVEYEAEVPFTVAGPRMLHVVYTPDQDPDGAVVGCHG